MTLRALLAVVLLAIFAVPAFAIDQQFQLSAATPKFEWEGQPDVARGSPANDEDTRSQIPCDSPIARPCEEILFKLPEAGKLTATVEGEAGVAQTTDVDAYLYKSDESGAQGEKLASGSAAGPDTVTFAKATPGFYLLVVDYYNAYNSGYKGVAKFTPAAVPVVAAAPAPVVIAPAPAAVEAKAPAAKTKTSKKAACTKKAKKIKNAKKRKAALKRCAKLKK
jgi:hypothetical protein